MTARPTYETQKNIAVQSAVGRRLADRLGAEARALPQKYAFDFAFEREDGTIVALAEVKERDVARTTYPTLILSLAKWMQCSRISEFAGVPGYIVIKWIDGIFGMKMPDYGLTVAFAGRKDRHDLDDMELVVEIPTKDFQPIDEMVL